MSKLRAVYAQVRLLQTSLAFTGLSLAFTAPFPGCLRPSLTFIGLLRPSLAFSDLHCPSLAFHGLL